MFTINHAAFRRCLLLPALISGIILASCAKKPVVDNGPVIPPAENHSDVAQWLTSADQSNLMKKQSTVLNFGTTSSQYPTILVDSSVTYQQIDGFGFALTGGSATLINSLDEARKDALITELFSTDSTFIGASYLRISIGASDLSATDFTYDERPAGETDTSLTSFSIDMERTDLIPVLKKILAINPDIKILGTPWTPPTWMKSDQSFVGGSLLPQYYGVYARYLVNYIKAMAAEGIHIDAITPQNEPLYGGNNPSMVMQASEELDFVKNFLGPAFEAAGLTTKIIVYDHNADRPDYPITILDDPAAAKYVDGSAFHLYGGSITALSQVHNAHPDKNVYFTEQWIGGPSNFGGDLNWHVKNLIIGATRNWSRNVIEWNLASDPNYEPHTNGGCSACLGALTIGTRVSRNVAYYIIAHASKFVRPGSWRISSSVVSPLENVAFINPAGQKVLIVLNDSNATQVFNIGYKGKTVTTSLEAGAVATYVW